VVAWSQDTRGTISGRVTDPSGAVVPGAQVVVTNVAMGNKTGLTTNADGLYQATFLIGGVYRIEAAAQGFKKVVREGVEVRIAERLEINFALEVGAAEQSVTITEEAPLLNVESASAGTVVDSRRVADLPLS